MRFSYTRALTAIILAVAGLFALDAVVFRSGLYTSILEPDSSTGHLRTDPAARAAGAAVVRPQPRRHAGRFALRLLSRAWPMNRRPPPGSPSATPGWPAPTPAPGTTCCAIWTPRATGYRAVVLGVDDYDDEDGAYDIGDDLATLHYVAARLRFSDVIPFTVLVRGPPRAVGGLPRQPAQGHRVPARRAGLPLPSAEAPGERGARPTAATKSGPTTTWRPIATWWA